MPRDYPNGVMDKINASDLPENQRKEMLDFMEGIMNALYDLADGRGLKWAKGIDAYCTANNAVADYFNKRL